MALVVLSLIRSKSRFLHFAHIHWILGPHGCIRSLDFDRPRLPGARLLEVILDVRRLRILVKLFETIAVQFDDFAFNVLACKVWEECTVTTAKTMQSLSALKMEGMVLRADDLDQHHEQYEQMPTVPEAPHGKVDAVLQLEGLVFIPELEQLLVVEEERLESRDI